MAAVRPFVFSFSNKRVVVADVLRWMLTAVWLLPALLSAQGLQLSTPGGAARTVASGGEVVYQVDTSAAAGRQVILSASGLPNEISAAFDTSSFTGSRSTSLSIRTTPTVPAGRYTFDVIASAGGAEARRTLQLNVVEKADFDLTASSKAVRLVSGSVTVPLRFQQKASGDASVTFSADVPAGWQVSFSDARTSVNGKVDAQVTAPANIASGNYTLKFIAQSNALQATTTVTVQAAAPDFVLLGTGKARGMKKGGAIRQVYTVASRFGFKGAVSFRAANLPPGVTADFSPSSVTGSGSTVMTLRGGANAPKSKGAIQVVAESGSFSQQSFLFLSMEDPDFGLSVSPDFQSLGPGESRQFTVGIMPANGFSDPVSLNLNGSIPGGTVTLAQNVISGESSTQLSVNTSATTAPGTYLLTINAISGTITHSATVSVVVSEQPTVAVSLTPSNSVIFLSRPSTYNLSVIPVNGFTGQVNLTVAGLPEGVTATLSSSLLTTQGTPTLTLTAAANTVPGTYEFAVIAATNDDTQVANGVLTIGTPLTPPWQSGDIGTVGQAGSSAVDPLTQTFHLAGGGNGFSGSTDAIQFAWQPLTADGEIVARITGLQSANGGSSAGLMIRTGLAPDAAQASLVFYANNTVGIRYRSSSGQGVQSLPNITTSMPQWAKLTRIGNTVNTAVSSDGITWVPAGASMTLPFGASAYIGLAVNANTTAATAKATFENVTVSAGGKFILTANPVSAIQPGTIDYSIRMDPLPGFNGSVTLTAAGGPSGTTFAFAPATLSGESSSVVTVTVPPGSPTGTYQVTVTGTSGALTSTVGVPLHVSGAGTRVWGNRDLTSATPAGYAQFNSDGTVEVQGSGGGLGGVDPYQFVWQPLTGNGEIVARVTGYSVSNGGSFAGVMLRTSLDIQAPTVGVAVVPNGTSYFVYRSSDGGGISTTSVATGTLPRWVRLVRVGNTVNSYVSSDGVNWTAVALGTSLPPTTTAYVGLGVVAANIGVCCPPTAKATFDNVSITSANDFLLSLDKTPALAGRTIVHTIRVGAYPGFTGAVGLSATGGPSGTTFSFSPSAINPGEASQLTITVPSGATAGTSGVTVTGTSGALARTLAIPLHVTGIGSGLWANQDMGSLAPPGYAQINSSDVLELFGAGSSFAGATDPQQLIWQPLTGDAQIVARIASFPDGPGSAAAGVTIRTALTQEAPQTSLIVFKSNGEARQLNRTYNGGNVNSVTGSTGSFPRWVKLTRTGNSVSTAISTDGSTWTAVGSSVTLPFGATAYVGMTISGGSAWTDSARAVFDNISFTQASQFLLSVSPTAVFAGTDVTHAVTVSPLAGFSGTVSLSVSGNPSGSTASISPGSVSSGGTATLTVSPGTATAGRYVLTVTGTSGATVVNATIPVVIPNPVEAPWTSGDVGAIGLPGVSTFSAGTFTIKGSGTGFDVFQYVYQPLVGDGQIVARLVSKTGGRAGLMLRETLVTEARHVWVEVDTSNNGRMGYRTTPTGSATSPNGSAAAAPRWMKLVRLGSNVTTFLSSDGTSWTQLGPVVNVPMAQQVYIGLAATSTNQGSLATATFDNVTVSGAQTFLLSADPSSSIQGSQVAYNINVHPLSGYSGTVALSATGLPSGVTASFAPSSVALTTAGGSLGSVLTLTVDPGTTAGTYAITVTGTESSNTATTTVPLFVGPSGLWTSNDVGSTGITGSASFNGTAFTLAGSGSGTDIFRYAYRPLAGDGQIVARLASKTGGRAGLMIRETLDTAARNIYVEVDTSNNGRMGYRTTPGGGVTSPGGSAAAPPRWMKIVRLGTNVSTFLSSDGTAWAQVGPTVSVNMAPQVYVGLWMTSTNQNALSSATFDNISVSGSAAFLLSSNPGGTIQGSQISYGINVHPSNGYAGTVALTASGLPSGVTASFAPSNVVLAATGAPVPSVLTLTVGSGVAAGTYSISVTGADGSLIATTEVPLVVAPSGIWTSRDIGSVGIAGSTSLSGSTFTITGSGSSYDLLQFAYRPLIGDGQIVARLVTKTSGRATLMIREGLDSASRYVYLEIDNSNNARMGYRSVANGSVTSPQGIAAAPPRWLKLVRLGTNFTAFISPDGVTWTQIGPIASVSMASQVYIGLVANSDNQGALSTATFDSVTVSGSQTFLLSSVPGATIQGSLASYAIDVNPVGGYAGTVTLTASGLPSGVAASFSPSNASLIATGNPARSVLTFSVDAAVTPDTYPITVTGTQDALTATTTVPLIVGPSGSGPWTFRDVGTVGVSGSTTFSGGTFTVTGSGNGLDIFQFAYRPLIGDGQIVARLASKTGGRAGLMIREELTDNARNAYIEVDTSNNGRFGYRSVVNGGVTSPSGSAAAPPRWMKLVRTGASISAWLSSDGTNWTQVSTTATVSMNATVYVGLAVTSTNQNVLNSATFDNVSVTGVPDFTLSGTPASQSVPVGTTASYRIDTSGLGGHNGAISFSIAGLPTGASAAFDPAVVQPGESSRLTIALSGSTPVTTSNLTVAASSGALVRTQPLTLTTTATGFSITANPASRTITPGTSTTYNILVSATGGFASPVALSLAGLPDGVTASFNPPSITGGGVSVLTLQSLTVAATGTSSLTVSATSGGVTQTVPLSLTLSNTPDFGLTVTTPSVSVQSGARILAPIALNTYGGFNGAVTFSVLGLPDGATATFAPASLTGSGQAILAIDLPLGTPNTTFPITVRGTNGSKVRKDTLFLKVAADADYSVDVSPTTQTIAAGQNATYTVTLSNSGGFAGQVTLNAFGLPAGMSGTFTPSILTGSGTSTLVISTTAAQAGGITTFQVRGDSGQVQRSGTADLQVTTSKDFSLAAAPTPLIVPQGGIGNFAVTTTAIAGYTGNVALQASGLPSGATAQFEPPTVLAGGVSALRISVPSGTTVQNYTVTVTGTGAGLSHNTQVVIQVRAASVYEAESVSNTRTGTASVSSCTNCSGSQRVDNIGSTGSLTFNGVSVAASGRYAVTVHYTDGQQYPLSAKMIVNGASATTLSVLGLPTGGWNSVAQVTREVTLSAGTNTIAFTNLVGGAPSIDKITVMPTAECDPGPVDAILVLDRSGSMAGTPMTNSKNAAKGFIDFLQFSTDQVGLASFSNTGTLNYQLSSNSAAVKSAIDALVASGGTYIGSGISQANTEFSSVRHNASASKVMIVLTDGVDSPPNSGTVTAANAAKSAGTRIITIGYGTSIDASFLQGLASSPSDYYAAPSTEEIENVYESIATAICRAPNTAPEVSAGASRSISVSTNVTLNGAMADDSQPVPGTLTASWTKISGPGTVTFTPADAPVTTINANTAGTYMLRLTVSDGDLSSYSDVTMTVLPTGTDVLEGESISSVLSGGASVAACPTCSGGFRVDNLGSNGGTQSGAVTFNITVATAGTYTLRVYYTNGSGTPRLARVSVNGDNTSRSFIGDPTTDWNTVAYREMFVNLVAGNNQITFSNNIGLMPSIDRVEVVFLNDFVCMVSPLDAVLLLDRSGSMSGTPLANTKTAAKAFVDRLSWQTDQMSVLSFTYDAIVHYPLGHDGLAAKTAIDSIVAGGGTTFAQGISAARAQLNGTSHNPAAQPVLVLLSDGADENTSATITEANQAKAEGIRIITVYIGSGTSTHMQALASSAGDYYQGTSGTEIGNIFLNIATGLCRPPNEPPSVYAGAPQAIVLPQTASLHALTSDDGQPTGSSLSLMWSRIAGPGIVAFSNPQNADTFVTFSTPGLHTLQLAASDGTTSTVSTVQISVSPANSAYTVTLTNPVGSPTLTGISQSVVAAVKDSAGNPVVGTSVQFGVVGSNVTSGSATTNSSGEATFSWTGTNRGLDTVQATAFTTAFSNLLSVAWVTPSTAISTTPVEARFYSADTSGLIKFTPNQQPLFQQVFPTISFNPSVAITANTSGVGVGTEPMTYVGTDPSNTYIGKTPMSGNGHSAASGGGSFAAAFRGSLLVATPGDYTFNINHDDGIFWGIGNGAQRVSGPLTNTPASNTTVLSAYPIIAADNRAAAANNTIVVNFPAAGIYPYEIDYTEGTGNQTLSMTVTLGANTIVVPPAAYIKLIPFAPITQNKNDTVTVSLIALDSANQPLAGLPISAVITGGHAQVLNTATDSTGYASVTYTGTSAGVTDMVQAQAVYGSAPLVSNTLTVTWNPIANQAPVVSAGDSQSIQLPASATLNGAVTDDGLPTGNLLTKTWSKVSGPGAVTFVDATQAQTSALFEVPGTYVLKLTANDSLLTAEATTTIVVNAAPAVSGGWIQSPTFDQQVSGKVPVVLAAGVNLQSGTLKMWPSRDPAAITILNSNTTGTGTIATIDTSMLANGAYWLQLTATNTTSETQNAIVRFQVLGEYKPGRVTSTVTDLVVPAAGLPIRIERIYDSLERDISTDFGYGWKIGIDALHWEVSEGQHVTFTINGRRRTFFFDPQPSILGYWIPRYTGEAGFYGSLTNTGDNCAGVLLHVDSLWQCGIISTGTPTNIYAANGWRYTDPTGNIYTVDASGKLTELRDLSGNKLIVTPNGVTSSAGNLHVDFARDSQGRITDITDPQGRHYLYDYDANGDLVSVTYPDIATPATYEYSSHLLTTEHDQRGHTAGSSTYYADGRLQSVTDAVGNTTQFAYDTDTRTTTTTNPDLGTVVTVADIYGMPLSVTDPLNRTTTYTYDANHNRLTETNPDGETTTYTYDSKGFRTSLTDHLNHTWSAVFNAYGGPTSVTNPLSQTQTVAYDSAFRISGITDSIGQVAQFTYNAQGMPLTLRDARNNQSSYTYDAYGNRTNYTDPLGRPSATVYDANGNLLSQTDARGKKTTYIYDAFNRRTSMIDADNKTTTYAYDGNGNKISETDALSRTTTYTYDNANRPTQITYPDTTTQSYTYDWRGNKLTETDQLGRVTKHVYDLAGQLTSTTVAFGTADAATTSYTYDPAGRQLTVTDPRSNVTTNVYDDAGRLTSVEDGAHNVTTFGYNAKGERTSMTDAKSRTTTYTYDSRGRQLVTTTPDTKTVTKTYDGLGLVLTTTDEENRTTTFEYDAASQLTAIIDALSQRTEYTYDPAGNKLTQKDARNNITRYAYDDLNRRITRTLPLNQVARYTYNAVGNVATHVDFNGKTTTYAYDSLNRLLSRTPDASFSAPTVSFTYTNTGQRATMIDASGTTTYTYSNRDQVLTKATPQGTLTYTYDLSGNVASVVSSNANGTSVAYAWDANNRLQSVTDARTSGVTNYTYDATNQLDTFTYANGVVHDYSYDNRDRMTGLSVTKSGVLASYTQTFSDTGRKLTAAENSGRTATYGYDSTYRLLSEGITGDPVTANNGSLTYTLDAVGNRSTLASTLAALSAQSFTYDNNDRISGDTFDSNGNTLTSGGTTYTYDFEDRLLTTSSGVTNVYDGDGNRVSRTVGGVTTKFLVDEHNPTGWPQVTEETVSGAVTAQYTHGLMRVSQKRGATVSYYGYDSGGSTRQLYDASGVVTDTYAYDAFGNTVAQTGSTVNLYQYRGEQRDTSLQMYYLRARWYVSRTGRFLTQDKYEAEPLIPSGYVESKKELQLPGSSATVNYLRIRRYLPGTSTNRAEPCSVCPYGFAKADPINRIDPSGFDAIFVEGTQGPVRVDVLQHALTHFAREGVTREVGEAMVRNAAEEAYRDLIAGNFSPGSVMNLYTEIDGTGWLVRLYLRAELWLEVSTAYPYPII